MIVLIILAIICVIIGIVGCLIPGIAGPPFSFEMQLDLSPEENRMSCIIFLIKKKIRWTGEF